MATKPAKTKSAARKPAAGRRAKPAGSGTAADAPSIRGQTLRLNIDAWRELKFLSIEQSRPAHDLLIEAVNDLFRKYRKRPLA